MGAAAASVEEARGLVVDGRSAELCLTTRDPLSYPVRSPQHNAARFSASVGCITLRAYRSRYNLLTRKKSL